LAFRASIRYFVSQVIISEQKNLNEVSIVRQLFYLFVVTYVGFRLVKERGVCVQNRYRENSTVKISPINKCLFLTKFNMTTRQTMYI